MDYLGNLIKLIRFSVISFLFGFMGYCTDLGLIKSIFFVLFCFLVCFLPSVCPSSAKKEVTVFPTSGLFVWFEIS